MAIYPGDRDSEYCPNCGQYAGGETVCPNCGAIISNSDDDMEGFHEEGDDSSSDDA